MLINGFENWTGVGETALTALYAYVALIALLRISGKRTLTQMNAFDFVVTIALGSMLSATILDKTLPLAEGLAGLAVLICLQFVLTWLAVRVPVVNRLIKSEPSPLVRNGELNARAMKHERITTDEIKAALRQGNLDGLDGVHAITLESSGKLTVVYK